MSSVHKITIENIEDNVYYQNNKVFFNQLVKLAKRGHCGASLSYKYQVKQYLDLRNWIISVIPDCINSEKYNWNTKIYWILHNITQFPKCQNDKCNKPMTMNIKSLYFGYWPFCSKKCQITSSQFKEKRRKTWRKNLGVEYPTQSKKVIKKREQNNLKKYGATSPSATKEFQEKSKQTRYLKNNGQYESQQTKKQREKTNIRLYGNKCVLHSDHGKRKTKETWNKKYGVDYPLKSKKVRNKGKLTCKEKYGVEFFQSSTEFKDLWKNEQWKNNLLLKQYETKRKNKSFNTSKEENLVFNLLKRVFKKVLRQYSSKEYPFNCDFYIPEIKLYIECNFSWVHQFHLFDPNNEKDIATMKKLLKKSKKSKYYKNVLYTWTVRDVLKSQAFISNNLNYKIFWNIDEVKQFLKSIPKSVLKYKKK